ncbi:hypothetical protein [Pseudomonas phage GP100]|nr:hypothetical protein [Pseudomonas phage GP100]
MSKCTLHDESKACTKLCSRLTVGLWPEFKGTLKEAVKENPFEPGTKLWKEWEESNNTK